MTIKEAKEHLKNQHLSAMITFNPLDLGKSISHTKIDTCSIAIAYYRWCRCK